MNNNASPLVEFLHRHAAILHDCTRRVTFAPGTTLFHEGDAGDAAHVILDGELVISRTIAGHEKAIAVARAGQIVGEIAPFSGQCRTATARTNSGAETIVIDRESLRHLKEGHPAILAEFYEIILKIITSRLRGAVDQYEVIYQILHG
jgi:CRP-like cAMP-binding protein